MWAYDLAQTIGTMTQDRSTLFREFAENVVSTNNMHLRGHTPFLTDTVLCQRLQLSMVDHLKICLSRNKDKPHKATELGHHIVNNTGDPTVDSLQAWILLVHEIDEDHHSRLGELHAAIAAVDQCGLKQSTEVARIGKSAAAVAATLQRHEPATSFLPTQDDNGRTHTSTRKGETPICPTPPGDGYVTRDINFVHDFYQKHPNGHDSTGRGNVMGLRPWNEFFTAFWGEFPALANRLCACVAAVPVPSGYVAQVQRRESFPPRYLPIASSSIIGIEDGSFGSDYNTSVEDSPPA
ncbi:hypothetical protein Moror_9515 [Moniliophthora roreri MCA 2997]|uniref:Uncharacterized protein n=1 Tax=Moniliophthora roreri (strain MCA 2997) TaxID=1381753 RepID=V2WGJ5_MONRO|nr:hypothetical protein Moror_9515 [Moniliophthora roreri MCA 2997]